MPESLPEQNKTPHRIFARASSRHFSCDDETDLRLLDEACTISANEVTPKTLETTV